MSTVVENGRMRLRTSILLLSIGRCDSCSWSKTITVLGQICIIASGCGLTSLALASICGPRPARVVMSDISEASLDNAEFNKGLNQLVLDAGVEILRDGSSQRFNSSE